MSETRCRNLVRQHGQLIREAEAAEVERLWQRRDLLDLEPLLVERQPTRLRASWPQELKAAAAAIYWQQSC